TVGRLGGDEFAVVFPGVATADQAQRSAQRLAAALREPYLLDGSISRIDVSIGIALFPGDGATAEELLRRADNALYRAKASGRGAIACYEAIAESAATDELMLEADLRRALELDQFELAYQPIFDAATGLPVAFEALLRWRHPTRGMIAPSHFIPMAERSGVIEKLGRWVMNTACTEAATWAMPVRLAINLSPAQFRGPDLEDQVIETLHRSGLAPDRLDLEVTEGVLLEHSRDVLATMVSLRSLGVGLVLDDFGTANSSLSYLRDFPFQQIKIDRSFVSSMMADPSAMTIVRMVLDMAAEMRLSVVAEGVEEQEELDALRRLGCGQVQGYLLGRPQSPERTREYLWQVNRRSGGVEALLGA
ncbi:MAG: bifunctional diguanylate cyclase/phosphodiesterase, partial [Gemmatimonadaceae bacterium]|nr:bifunctional diguanylate cyclase/phosphodiesterase [Acetobacteraceae bacterium]